MARGITFLASLLVAALVAASVSIAGEPVSAAAPLRVVSLSIAPGSVVRSAPSVAVGFNAPMNLAAVRYAATLVVAQGTPPSKTAEWKEVAPVAARLAGRGRTVVLGFAQDRRPLPPGAYSLVIGPAAASASGTAMMYPSVTDFVVAPHRSLWEKMTVRGKVYDVWVVPAGTGSPVRDDQYLVEGASRAFLTSGRAVRVVYATDGQGRLVTSNGLFSQLGAYAEEEGWLRFHGPSTVPGALALDASSVAWATANGPNSALGNFLYGLAKSLGEDVAAPPSQSDVDRAELATSLADEGPPGTWASQFASDKAVLDLARTGAKGYVLAQQLTTLLSEGTLSLPGAGAAGAMLHVLNAVNGAGSFTLGTLQQLYQAEWEAAQAAAEAGPLRTVASALTSSDAFLKSDIKGLLTFSLAGEQAAIARAAAAYAANQTYDLIAEVAKELASDADPIAAAVVAGLEIGFWIASFTGWDRLRAAFYQAVEQARAEHGMVDATGSLETSLASTAAPTSDQIDGALLGWRLALNTMADFYAQCIIIVHLDQWGQAVDSKFPGLEALVGAQPAQDYVPSWQSDERFYRQQASGLVPGLSQAQGGALLSQAQGGALLASVATRFPAVPVHEVPFSLCGTVISEPGRYVLPVAALISDVPDPDGPDCAIAGLRMITGVEVAAPGATVDLNRHLVGLCPCDVGIWLGRSAAGSTVENGTISDPSLCCLQLGMVDLASGTLSTHLRFNNFRMAFLAAGATYSRFISNTVTSFGGGEGTFPWSDLGAGPLPGITAVSYGAVSLDHADHMTVAHDTVQRGDANGVGVVLLSSSANSIDDNYVVSNTNGFYAGCDGFVAGPPAHPLTHTSCAPSTGNSITGNKFVIVSVGRLGPAIALGSSTARNTVAGNRVSWTPYHDFALWDYNGCGVNTWHGNTVQPNPAVTHNRLSNWPCVH